MNPQYEEDRDPLLDAGLEEVLGGATPPDLSARILQSLRAGILPETSPEFDQLRQQWQSEWRVTRRAEDAEETNGATLADGAARPHGAASFRTSFADLQGQPANGSSRNRAAPRAAPLPAVRVRERAADRRSSRSWGAWGAVAIGTLLAVGLGWVVWTSRRGEPVPSPEAVAEQDKGVAPRTDFPPARPAADASHVARESSSDAPPRRQQDRRVTERRATDIEPPFGASPAVVSDEPRIAPRALEIEPRPDAEVVAEVDRLLAAGWSANQLVPSPPATDAEWCRRAFVRLIGRIPTVEEVRRYVENGSPSKRAQLVSQLVEGSVYADEFADYWAGFWANALIGRTAGTRPGDLASREDFVAYLRRQLLVDRPFHQVVRELVAASGSRKASASNGDEAGAANFLLAHYSPDGTVATAAVSRLFLGQRFQCAQCHTHPGNAQLAQANFWQLDAFFGQVRVERDRDSGDVRLVDRDMESDAVFYEQLDGYKRVAYPVLPDGTAIPKSGKVADVRRRALLADWIAQSEQLPQALTNRVWSHFFGYGLTQPVDDFGPHNPGQHAVLLKTLADQFAAHEFRLKRLTTWIAMSDAFARSSKVTEFNLADAPERGEGPWFSRYYTRQMPPEAVVDSLRLVAEARRAGGNEADRTTFLGQFAHRMGTDDGEEVDTFRGDIRQSLILMTGPAMERALNKEQGGVLAKVLSENMTREEQVTHLFLAAVARPPTRQEMAQSLKMIEQSKPEVALQDIWWALLNSNEFILDH